VVRCTRRAAREQQDHRDHCDPAAEGQWRERTDDGFPAIGG
jgi:hypothetical protein